MACHRSLPTTTPNELTAAALQILVKHVHAARGYVSELVHGYGLVMFHSPGDGALALLRFRQVRAREGMGT